ncbi:Murein DD-endopeptidase MepM [bacterium HR28]|nr:Murein DD-endopeptidase MepM [bacterium HR28]
MVRARNTALGLVILVFASVLPLAEGEVHGSAPFALPFAEPPGVSTWFVSQWYGNTVTAYRNRAVLYRAGQGLHFGVDFAARCGTIVRAIGDGIVVAVDGPYGAAPHNVVIAHPNGYRSLYGHLLERSPLQVGQRVQQGDPVGKVGDPASPNCDRAPHLHLEIRDASMRRAFNPVSLIEADWRRLTLGLTLPGQRFVLPYESPMQWRTPWDQPDVTFGGILLNEWQDTWPR